MGKSGRVWIAERAAYGIRRCSHLEPLQQGLGLRMIRERFGPFPEPDVHGGVGKDFDGIAGLQAGLADFGVGGHAWELPERVTLLTNGSFNVSEISWERAVTSAKPAPKSPGEIQLAYLNNHRG